MVGLGLARACGEGMARLGLFGEGGRTRLGLLGEGYDWWLVQVRAGLG